MPGLLTFILRLFMVATGLIFAASLAVAAVVMVALWAAGAAWAKLTGRPASPFIVRIHPRAGFERMYRRGAPASRTPRADAVKPGQQRADVTDVDAKRLSD